MNESLYSPEVLDHFEHPRNPGEVRDADLVCERSNPVCGDVLLLSARVEAGSIDEIRFLARGCVSAMACGSLATELAGGKTIEELGEISPEFIDKAMGGLPDASKHAAELACDALQGLASAAGGQDPSGGG